MKHPPSAGFLSPSGEAVPSAAVKEKKNWGACGANSFKNLPQGHEDPEYVLSFEIGQRESGFYSERTDRITQPSSIVLLYRCIIVYMGRHVH